MIRLIDWLQYNGFRVHTKRAILHERPLRGEHGIHYIQEVKGNIEIEIVVEAMRATAYCDTIVLFTGSGELLPLVKAIQHKGCRVVVVSTEHTTEITVSNELHRQGDIFLDLETLRPFIGMDSRHDSDNTDV